jgi:hypothetical protein
MSEQGGGEGSGGLDHRWQGRVGEGGLPVKKEEGMWRLEEGRTSGALGEQRWCWEELHVGRRKKGVGVTRRGPFLNNFSEKSWVTQDNIRLKL